MARGDESSALDLLKRRALHRQLDRHTLRILAFDLYPAAFAGRVDRRASGSGTGHERVDLVRRCAGRHDEGEAVFAALVLSVG